jgi:hypothetical protein
MLQKRTRLVLDTIDQLVADGAELIRPGDVATVLREKSQPLGIWEIRYELSTLESEGILRNDPDSGEWILSKGRARKAG